MEEGDSLTAIMEGVWDANRKLDRITWLLEDDDEEEEEGPIFTPDERAEFARHQRNLKQLIERRRGEIATQKQQQG